MSQATPFGVRKMCEGRSALKITFDLSVLWSLPGPQGSFRTLQTHRRQPAMCLMYHFSGSLLILTFSKLQQLTACSHCIPSFVKKRNDFGPASLIDTVDWNVPRDGFYVVPPYCFAVNRSRTVGFPWLDYSFYGSRFLANYFLCSIYSLPYVPLCSLAQKR